MNPKEILFRASSMGDVMTGSGLGKTAWKPVSESTTTLRKLVQMHRELTWKRRKQLTNKYIEKGLRAEEDAITLYCRIKKTMFTKNTTRLNNSHFTGELDLHEGKEIMKTKHTIDIKNSWDWTTFPSIVDTIDADYDYQGQVYMDLTGAGLHTVVHCLLNNNAQTINKEKLFLSYKPGMLDQYGNETDDFKSKCRDIEINHIVCLEEFFNHPENQGFIFHNDIKNWEWDIPKEQRIHEIDVVRDDKKIAAMKTRVDECREWMSTNLKWD